jgi:hypothetical protein
LSQALFLESFEQFSLTSSRSSFKKKKTSKSIFILAGLLTDSFSTQPSRKNPVV